MKSTVQLFLPRFDSFELEAGLLSYLKHDCVGEIFIFKRPALCFNADILFFEILLLLNVWD